MLCWIRLDLTNLNSRDVFCCLATTRADAGSADKFIKIDQTYVLDSAKIIQEENKPAGSELAPVHFLYCSSTVSGMTLKCVIIMLTAWKKKIGRKQEFHVFIPQN